MRFDRRKDIHPKYLLLTFTIIGIVLIVLSYAAQALYKQADHANSERNQ